MINRLGYFNEYILSMTQVVWVVAKRVVRDCASVQKKHLQLLVMELHLPAVEVMPAAAAAVLPRNIF